MATVAFTTRANLVGGQPENIADVTSCLDALLAGVNSVADTQLVSPNNAIWRTLAEQAFQIPQSTLSGSYYFSASGTATASGGLVTSVAPVQLDPAEYVVAGKTAKLRLRVTMYTGGAPATSPAFAIYGVGTLTGTSTLGVPLLSALTGSTVTFTTPAANTQLSTATTAFDFPGAAGEYVFGVNLPGATSAGSAMMGRLQLAISHT